jgi:hypothetical protein
MDDAPARRNDDGGQGGEQHRPDDAESGFLRGRRAHREVLGGVHDDEDWEACAGGVVYAPNNALPTISRMAQPAAVNGDQFEKCSSKMNVGACQNTHATPIATLADRAVWRR